MQTSGKSCREKENVCLRPEMGLPPHQATVLARLDRGRPVKPGQDAKLLLPRMPIQSPGAFSWTRL
jgi:hypothetical protein